MKAFFNVEAEGVCVDALRPSSFRLPAESGKTNHEKWWQTLSPKSIKHDETLS
jgi:hypothetical protein